MESKEDVPSEASGNSINLSVRALDGTLMEFIVTAGSLVQNLKDRIAESAGVPPVTLRLFLGDRELDGSATFGKSGIKAGDVVTRILVRLGNAVWSTEHAFFALLQTGKVVAWGGANYGGRLDEEEKAELEEAGVQQVWSTFGAFFALLQTGKVVAWGDAGLGGRLDAEVKAALEEAGVQQVWSTTCGAFLALLQTGKVVAWGGAGYGGSLDAEVKAALEEAGVEQVWSTTCGAFLALLQTGKVVAWGGAGYGGRLDAEVKAQLEIVGLAAK